MTTLFDHWRNLKTALAPYADVIIFMLTLLVANYAWKWTVIGDESNISVTWFGVDITAPFDWFAANTAAAVYWLISLFRDTVYMSDALTIRFESGSGTRIVWACTALKQSFIWLCLLLTTRGGWKHKLWFIPFGWLCIYLFNILRIALIALFIEFHPDWFHMLHDYLFKYLFYGMMFALWLWFVERIRYVSTKGKRQRSSPQP